MHRVEQMRSCSHAIARMRLHGFDVLGRRLNARYKDAKSACGERGLHIAPAIAYERAA
jgi:hypothetical protein